MEHLYASPATESVCIIAYWWVDWIATCWCEAEGAARDAQRWIFQGGVFFGLKIIVSAFVNVGAQQCQAHVEPHSHSSNTHIFKNCLWYQYTVCEQRWSNNIPDNYCSAAAINEISALCFVFLQECILYQCICPMVTWDPESNIILIQNEPRELLCVNLD